MARRRRRQPPLPWLTGKDYRWDSNRQDSPWVKLTASLMRDETFRALTPSEQLVYFCFAIEAGGSAGPFRFNSATARQYHISIPTLRRSVKALCDKGFITMTRPTRTDSWISSKFDKYLPNEYEFCLDWKNE